MADSLYLNLWFPSFPEATMMPRLLAVLQQFPFSQERTGIGYVGIHGVSWSEPPVFEESFDYRAQPEHAVALAADFLHDDDGYVFEALWDLWSAGDQYDSWILKPWPVKFVVHGTRFEDGIAEESGHIQIDFGVDTPFLFDQVELTEMGEHRVKQNIKKLVSFTSALEKHCGLAGRLLWSESEENLAQKLIARLQRVN
jgi:hypothetical protein